MNGVNSKPVYSKITSEILEVPRMLIDSEKVDVAESVPNDQSEWSKFIKKNLQLGEICT